MPDWTQSLPTLDAANLRPVFDPLIGHEADAARELAEDRKHVRISDRRVLLDARRLQNCILYDARKPPMR